MALQESSCGLDPGTVLPGAAACTAHGRVLVALEAIRAGRPVLVTDDEDRENEADLIVAADRLTVATMAQMIRDGSGIVCLCITSAHAAALGLRPMVEDNRTRFGTAFTASIEAAQGVGTGVSASDRLTTVQAAMTAFDMDSSEGSVGRYKPAAQAIVSPGHMFPLIAREGGVLTRRGHTEATIDLARWAGLRPAGVLCELMNPDGTMAAGEQVFSYADKHQCPVVSVEELIQYARAQG